MLAEQPNGARAQSTTALQTADVATVLQTAELEASLSSWGVCIGTSSQHPVSNVPLAYTGQKELLLPTYVAFVAKSFRNIDPHNQTIDLAFTLVLRINYGKLPPELTDELTGQLVLRWNDIPLSLDSDTTDKRWDAKSSLYVMTTRVRLQGVDFSSEFAGTASWKGLGGDYHVWKDFPFDRPRLTFRLEFTSHTAKAALLKGWRVRYNIHEFLGEPQRRGSLSKLERIKPVMSFKSTVDSLPAFDFGKDGLDLTYVAETKTVRGAAGTSSPARCPSSAFAVLNDHPPPTTTPPRPHLPPSLRQVAGVRFQYFPIITFHIPLYRHPYSPLRAVVFPLLVTNAAVLLSLFMSPSLYEARMSTLVTVLLALFAFLNVARGTLPDVPIATWLDWRIFDSVGMCFAAMVESLLAKYEYVDDHSDEQLRSYYFGAVSQAHEGHAPSVTEPRAMGFASQVRPLAARRALAPRRARPTCSGLCACSAACSSAAPLVDTAVHPGRRHRPSRPAGPAEVRPAPTHARAPPEHLESLPWPQQLASGRPNV